MKTLVIRRTPEKIHEIYTEYFYSRSWNWQIPDQSLCGEGYRDHIEFRVVRDSHELLTNMVNFPYDNIDNIDCWFNLGRLQNILFDYWIFYKPTRNGANAVAYERKMFDIWDEIYVRNWIRENIDRVSDMSEQSRFNGAVFARDTERANNITEGLEIDWGHGIPTIHTPVTSITPIPASPEEFNRRLSETMAREVSRGISVPRNTLEWAANNIENRGFRENEAVQYTLHSFVPNGIFEEVAENNNNINPQEVDKIIQKSEKYKRVFERIIGLLGDFDPAHISTKLLAGCMSVVIVEEINRALGKNIQDSLKSPKRKLTIE